MPAKPHLPLRSCKSTSPSQSSVIADAAAHAGILLSEGVMQSFTVYLGQRSITFIVDPALGSDPSALSSCVFRNCFNALEVAMLAAVTTAKTDVDRSQQSSTVAHGSTISPQPKPTR